MIKENNSKIKFGSIAYEILDILEGLAQLVPKPFESRRSLILRLKQYERNRVVKTFNYLEKAGYIAKVKKNEDLIGLTELGQARALKIKSKRHLKSKRSDKLNTFVIFDIPEEYKRGRDFLRRLLIQNEFMMLQKSVFVGPWKLESSFWKIMDELQISKFITIAEGNVKYIHD